MSNDLPTSADAATDSYRTRFDPDAPDELTGALVAALATVEGVPPTSLDVCLDDAVDLDALERLVDRDGLDEIRFSVATYAVTVHGTGRIEIR